jgi:hypothetical protein
MRGYINTGCLQRKLKEDGEALLVARKEAGLAVYAEKTKYMACLVSRLRGPFTTQIRQYIPWERGEVQIIENNTTKITI